MKIVGGERRWRENSVTEIQWSQNIPIMLLRFCEGWRMTYTREIVTNTQGEGKCKTLPSKGGWLSREKQQHIKTLRHELVELNSN